MTTILIHVDICHSVALVLHEQRVVSSESILCGWHIFLKTFRSEISRKYNMLFDEDLEDSLRQAFGDSSNSTESSWPFSGRDIITGQMLSLSLTKQNLYKMVSESLRGLTDFVRTALEKTPPEYTGEILESGITLSCENKPFLAVFAYHLKREMAYAGMEIGSRCLNEISLYNPSDALYYDLGTHAFKIQIIGISPMP